MLFTFAQKKSNRPKKVSQVIKEEIAQVILEKKIYHPILDQLFITVQHVDLSPDLRNAVVVVSFLEKNNEQQGVDALNQLSSNYRKLLALKLNLRCSPYLKFTTDTDRAYTSSLDKIWSKI